MYSFNTLHVYVRHIEDVHEEAYMKFGEILSICSEDIERKRNYKCMKNEMILSGEEIMNDGNTE